MSKKFNSIKKGLTKAIEDADGGVLGTRIHRPHLSLPLFSQPEQFDENSTQVYEWRLAMNKRFFVPTMATMVALFGFSPAMAESGVTIYGNIESRFFNIGHWTEWQAANCN